MLYNICKILLKIFYSLLFFPKITGRENIPRSGGYILASNHISNFDPPFVVIFAPGKQLILAKAELFKNSFARWFLMKMGAYPVKRDSADITPIKVAISHLKKGKSVL